MRHVELDKYRLDSIDLGIIKAMTDNARITMTELGNRAGRSRVAVFNRIKEMEDAGIIAGYTTVINWDLVEGMDE